GGADSPDPWLPRRWHRRRPEKCRYLVAEIGFDAAIDYKTEDVRKALSQRCPKGIDVYFDNVGGDILDAALANLGRHARIVICGAISQYNNTTPDKGPSNYLSLLVNRASMTGMVVYDYADRYPEATSAIASWLAAGRLKSREDIVAGFATFPETLLKLFAGENFGKLCCRSPKREGRRSRVSHSHEAGHHVRGGARYPRFAGKRALSASEPQGSAQPR